MVVPGKEKAVCFSQYKKQCNSSLKHGRAGCKTGEAVITTGGRLPAKFVIHTVGPVWNGGRELLANCYRNALQVAIANYCKTIAFPNISTGVYRFPKAEAASIAVHSVRDFFTTTDKIDNVIFICFDEENFSLIQQELSPKQ